MLTKAEIEIMDPEAEMKLAWVLWEDAREKISIMPLTEEQKQILDVRLDYALKHPDSGRPWEEVMNELDARYGDA